MGWTNDEIINALQLTTRTEDEKFVILVDPQTWWKIKWAQAENRAEEKHLEA